MKILLKICLSGVNVEHVQNNSLFSHVLEVLCAVDTSHDNPTPVVRCSHVLEVLCAVDTSHDNPTPVVPCGRYL